METSFIVKKLKNLYLLEKLRCTIPQQGWSIIHNSFFRTPTHEGTYEWSMFKRLWESIRDSHDDLVSYDLKSAQFLRTVASTYRQKWNSDVDTHEMLAVVVLLFDTTVSVDVYDADRPPRKLEIERGGYIVFDPQITHISFKTQRSITHIRLNILRTQANAMPD
jgi:hypothetical protein